MRRPNALTRFTFVRSKNALIHFMISICAGSAARLKDNLKDAAAQLHAFNMELSQFFDPAISIKQNKERRVEHWFMFKHLVTQIHDFNNCLSRSMLVTMTSFIITGPTHHISQPNAHYPYQSSASAQVLFSEISSWQFRLWSF